LPESQTVIFPILRFVMASNCIATICSTFSAKRRVAAALAAVTALEQTPYNRLPCCRGPVFKPLASASYFKQYSVGLTFSLSSNSFGLGFRHYLDLAFTYLLVLQPLRHSASPVLPYTEPSVSPPLPRA
jgi:hypothetical protein